MGGGGGDGSWPLVMDLPLKKSNLRPSNGRQEIQVSAGWSWFQDTDTPLFYDL